MDEYHLTNFPYLVGGGRSLFAGVVKPGPSGLVPGTVSGNGTAGPIYRRPR